jgi:nitroreductase
MFNETEITTSIQGEKMDTLEAIHNRRSIREYQDKTIPGELITKLLAAAMAAPSARNQQPWEFIVITDKGILSEISTINPYAQMAKKAPLAILVCGNLRIETSPGYWVVDCAAAVQNMLLCAHALGLGAVWTGTYPNEERMDGYTTLLNLPEHVLPHTLVVLGYPAEQPPHQDRFNPERIHYDGW